MSNLIDGKKIKDEILAELKEKFSIIGGAVLAVVWVGDDPATAKFVEYKKKVAEKIGVDLRLFEYEDTISQEDLEQGVNRLIIDREISGIIVQLPLPKQIDVDKIISLIPPEKDVDALSKDPKVKSPVVGAVEEILERYKVSLTSNKFVVAGQGKLVGRPVTIWLASRGAEVSVFDRQTKDTNSLLIQADVIISGMGQPEFIIPSMVKDDVILIDAGTSEQGGRLAGDIDPACAAKAKLFTPVPGGLGPVVLAKLFENLWKLSNSMK